MASASLIPADYWKNLQPTPKDIEFLHTHLFELETPLTSSELVSVLVAERIHVERASALQKRTAEGKQYIPKEQYQVGDDLIFPALDWKKGKVASVRVGVNPEVGSFDVLAVAFEDSAERLFAAGLANHALNNTPVQTDEEDGLNLAAILNAYGNDIQKKIESAFDADEGLVRIAGRWFPRALLIGVQEVDLNVAEASLDVAGGEPQPVSALLKDVELPVGVNPKLAEFSLNFALQEDKRFDEVGPAGEVLWCLKRLEPDGVQEVPATLRYEAIEHDPEDMTAPMMALESQLDDELTPVKENISREDVKSVTISLIYPHLRAGTLPMSAWTRALFPTAYESPRVRFTLVDGKTKQRIPAWVVREHGYVYGLREWYKAHQLIPGSLVQLRRSEKPGEVIVEAKTQKASKDWVRTLMIGTDGGMVFAMLKQPITAEFNDRMVIYVSDFKALDPLWEKKRSFEELVVMVMRELTKLTPQGHVHAQELYAGVNLVRRVPPAPLFTLLATNPIFKHVGDLHFRLDGKASS